MKDGERVVVLVSLWCKQHRELGMHVARIRELGLTAYADTQQEAQDKVKRMFAAFVAQHRKRGTLEARLNASGLKWCLEKDYQGNTPKERVSSKIYCPTPAGSSRRNGEQWVTPEEEMAA